MNPMRTLALKQMEKEYKKLYKAGKIIITDTEQMAKDVIEHSPVSLSTLGVEAEDVKAILDKVKEGR